MPPKTKFTTDDIIEAAIKAVRKNGIENLTARSIANVLKSSTMPIYYCKKSMADIEVAVIQKAWDVLLEYQLKPRSGDPYIDLGLGYVMFAKEEKHLFKCVHYEKYRDLNWDNYYNNFNLHLERLADYPLFGGVSKEEKERFMLQGWLFSHGIASLVNTGTGSPLPQFDSEEAIKNFFIESNIIAWEGLKTLTGNNGAL